MTFKLAIFSTEFYFDQITRLGLLCFGFLLIIIHICEDQENSSLINPEYREQLFQILTQKDFLFKHNSTFIEQKIDLSGRIFHEKGPTHLLSTVDDFQNRIKLK